MKTARYRLLSITEPDLTGVSPNVVSLPFLPDLDEDLCTYEIIDHPDPDKIGVIDTVPASVYNNMVKDILL